MKTKKMEKQDAGKTQESAAIVNAAVGAVVGGIFAGPVGVMAGAAAGALVEKGPPVRKPATSASRRSKPAKESPNRQRPRSRPARKQGG